MDIEVDQAARREEMLFTEGLKVKVALMEPEMGPYVPLKAQAMTGPFERAAPAWR